MPGWLSTAQKQLDATNVPAPAQEATATPPEEVEVEAVVAAQEWLAGQVAAKTSSPPSASGSEEASEEQSKEAAMVYPPNQPDEAVAMASIVMRKEEEAAAVSASNVMSKVSTGVTESLAQVVVTDVADGCAASGLVVKGDRLLAINRTRVTDEAQGRVLAKAAVGEIVFSILRGGAHVAVTGASYFRSSYYPPRPRPLALALAHTFTLTTSTPVLHPPHARPHSLPLALISTADKPKATTLLGITLKNHATATAHIASTLMGKRTEVRLNRLQALTK